MYVFIYVLYLLLVLVDIVINKQYADRTVNEQQIEEWFMEGFESVVYGLRRQGGEVWCIPS